MRSDPKADSQLPQKVVPLAHEEWFRMLVDSVRDYAIFLLSVDGTVQSWNPGAERFKGYRAHEIIGRHFSVFYTPEDIATRKPWRELEEATRLGRAEDEGWRLRKDGTMFWASVIITALRDDHGALIGFGKVTRDLTERRRGEEALEQALRDLRVSNRELDEYARFVAHDLQEPLRRMASFSELLEFEYSARLDDTARQYIHYVVDGAHRLRELITDVLDYARIDKLDGPIELVDVGVVLCDALADFDLVIAETGAKVDVRPLPSVRAEVEPLRRVLQNLLSNALKYRHQDRPPHIQVRSERTGAEWVISVADNGIGFDPAQADRILRPFHRLHTKEAYPGSGLGLASARKILTRYSARLWATSEPGVGSTFFFAFPADQ
jgi:PAS domain S-box-containing protein